MPVSNGEPRSEDLTRPGGKIPSKPANSSERDADYHWSKDPAVMIPVGAAGVVAVLFGIHLVRSQMAETNATEEEPTEEVVPSESGEASCEIEEFNEADLIPDEMKTEEARAEMERAWRSASERIDGYKPWVKNSASRATIAASLTKKGWGYRDRLGKKLKVVKRALAYTSPGTIGAYFSEDDVNYARHIEEVTGVPAELIIAAGMIETADTEYIYGGDGEMGSRQHMPGTARSGGERVFYGEGENNGAAVEIDGVTMTVGRFGDYEDSGTGDHYMSEDQRKSRRHHLTATAVILWKKKQALGENADWLDVMAKYNGAPSFRPGDDIKWYVTNPLHNSPGDILSRTYVLRAGCAMVGARDLVNQTAETEIQTPVQVENTSPTTLATLHKKGFGLDDLYEGGMNAELLMRIPLAEISQQIIIPDLKKAPKREENWPGFDMDTIMTIYFKARFKSHMANSNGLRKGPDGRWVIDPGTFKAGVPETSIDTTFSTRKKASQTNPPTLSDLPIPLEELIAANPHIFGGIAIDEGVKAYMRSTSLRPEYDVKFVDAARAQEFCDAAK
ncbi:hypothetical protein HOG48_01785 [Candidatus Peregrinibacteria bacterium]|jgi:hypothetical protein|nr:hypothetical protein [Candidatus Peregrinibacteria bacterium]